MSLDEPIDELIEQLKPDPWREENPFPQDMEECHRVLFDPSTSRAEKAEALSGWLERYQPCLFGRMAAKRGALSFCILTESDLAKGHQHIREVIQDSRLTWKREALTGKKHGFIILAESERLACAEPSASLQKIALRLCELYLSQTGLNQIFHDELILEIERPNGMERRRWKVGVNYFAAQGDGRWWHDHRIPGGVGFSMNSVGHMARQLAEEAIRKDPELAKRATHIPVEKLVSWALPLAMRTIHTASKGTIPGTRLALREEAPDPGGIPEGKREQILGKVLCPFSEDYYYGGYHTDETIPAEYFAPSQERPAGLPEKQLVFTYLHRKTDEDYESMGLGERILETLGLEYEGEDNADT